MRTENSRVENSVRWGLGIIFLITGIAGFTTSILSDKVYSFANLISILSIIAGVYFVQNIIRKLHRVNFEA